jgi:hypothetical protein
VVPSPTGRKCACGGQLYLPDARGPDTQPHCTNPLCFMNRDDADILGQLGQAVELGDVQSTVHRDAPTASASGEQLELAL